MNKKRISIRIDERTLLIISELSKKYEVNISCIARVLLINSIEQIINGNGYIKKIWDEIDMPKRNAQ